MSNLRSRFPDIIPMETIRVDAEEHLFKVIEYDGGQNSVKQQYTLDKSPFEEVESVVGIVNNEEYTFEKGTDYDVVDTDADGRFDAIDFSIGGESPDANTDFQVTYLAESIISRYVGSFNDEVSRLEGDRQNVINSHYINKATDTGYIDNFEDEEIIEYTTDYCQGRVRVQSSVVLQGGWALEMKNECNGDPLTIRSSSGLQRYPRRNDKFIYYMQLTNSGDIGHFDFMYQQNEDGGEQFYSIRLNAEANEFVVQKDDGSNKKSTANVDLGAELGDWLRVEAKTDSIGTVAASVYDNEGVKLGDVSIEDTSYTNGGIRWRAFNGSGTGLVYADAADIVERESSDLENIGAIFGDLGKRRGRSDEEYATFLRSIVQSFSGRGTVSGIKFTVASGLELPPEQVTIREDFVNNKYDVEIERPFPPHELVTLTDLADLADPSGVEFSAISYDVADERVVMDDDLSFTTGYSISDEVSATDSASINSNQTTTTESVTVGDGAQVDSGLTTSDEDVLVDDTAIADAETTTIAENTTADDTVATDTTDVEWDSGSWDNMDWAVEHN